MKSLVLILEIIGILIVVFIIFPITLTYIIQIGIVVGGIILWAIISEAVPAPSNEKWTKTPSK